MIEQTVNARLEADYGIQYLEKAFVSKDPVPGTIANAIWKMKEGRMALGRYCLYLGSPNPYPQSSNPDNDVIEHPVDTVDSLTVIVNENYDRVKHLKFMRNGLNNMIEKVLSMRMLPSTVKNPNHVLMSRLSLEHALQCFEMAHCWLGVELGEIAKANPGKYPTEAELPLGSIPEQEKSSEVEKTNEIVEARLPMEPVVENSPLTGADFLPGGRAYKQLDE